MKLYVWDFINEGVFQKKNLSRNTLSNVVYIQKLTWYFYKNWLRGSKNMLILILIECYGKKLLFVDVDSKVWAYHTTKFTSGTSFTIYKLCNMIAWAIYLCGHLYKLVGTCCNTKFTTFTSIFTNYNFSHFYIILKNFNRNLICCNTK